MNESTMQIFDRKKYLRNRIMIENFMDDFVFRSDKNSNNKTKKLEFSNFKISYSFHYFKQIIIKY